MGRGWIKALPTGPVLSTKKRGEDNREGRDGEREGRREEGRMEGRREGGKRDRGRGD
jgi:hypothetical protein